MSEEMKIDHDTYLKALAMFTLANQFYKDARDIQLRMADMLGLEDGSQVDDAVYSGDLATPRDFDKALRLAGIRVAPEQKDDL